MLSYCPDAMMAAPGGKERAHSSKTNNDTGCSNPIKNASFQQFTKHSFSNPDIIFLQEINDLTAPSSVRKCWPYQITSNPRKTPGSGVATLTKPLNKNKTPGLDGLSSEFYQCFLPLLKDDLLKVLQKCITSNALPISCRRAVITILPKQGDLFAISNWRTVSLLNTEL